MEDRPNRLAQIIDVGGYSLKSNNWANGLFSLKSVVSRLVKVCIPEYEAFSHELIAEECLDSFQDPSGNFNSELVKALMTKRSLPNGFMMDCDLLFELHPPKHLLGEWKPQLLNIEVQNDSRQLDRCLGRGMLYASGIYFMEYDMIYTFPRFEDAWKVNSIWICPTAPENRQGTILRFRMTGDCNQSNGYMPSHDDYDKLRLTFLNACGDNNPEQKDICGFIWALTTSALTAEQRKRTLQEVFDMEMTQVTQKAIDDYDWMLDLYGRKRFATEKKQSREEVREEGREEGFAEGRNTEKEELALKMLKSKYHPNEIGRLTGLSMTRILQIAKDNNLDNCEL